MESFKILVVDDEPSNLEVIIAHLEKEKQNFKIFQAINGEMAFEVAEKIVPDIIVMDWQMPILNGVEALKLLKQSKTTREIPVIMATGVMTSTFDLRIALDNGAVDYIRKPITHAELIARINSALKLSRSYQKIKRQNEELVEANAALKEALNEIKKLNGMLPICSSCKKIRDDKGYWNEVENYFKDRSGVEFSHSICPTCMESLYPKSYKKSMQKTKTE